MHVYCKKKEVLKQCQEFSEVVVCRVCNRNVMRTTTRCRIRLQLVTRSVHSKVMLRNARNSRSVLCIVDGRRGFCQTRKNWVDPGVELSSVSSLLWFVGFEAKTPKAL